MRLPKFQSTVWVIVLTTFLVLFSSVDLSRPAPVRPGIGAVAQAATKKKTTKKRKKRSPIKPEIKDDLSLPPGEVLASQMDRFFRSNRPLYASFVAIDPATGNILSFSQYSRIKGARIRNPGLYTGFPAASVFKIVSSAALIEDGGVEPSVEVCYTGGSHGLNAGHLVDRKKERACRSFKQAFASSTNAVFGKLAVKHLDADTILKMASRFGFGKKITIGNRSSTSKARRPKGKLGLARMAAGFTSTNMSTLHGAVIAAVIANGGVWPSEVSMGGSGTGVSLTVIKPETAAAIGGMMLRAVESGTGTRYLSRISRIDGHSPAIKTGSLTSRDGSGIWNNWMVGFYPEDKPEIAFAVHVGHKGGGFLKAGHATRYALETWISLKKARR